MMTRKMVWTLREDWKAGKWQFRRKKEDLQLHNSGEDITLPQNTICTNKMTVHYQIFTKHVNG